MQAVDNFSLTRRSLDFEDFADIIRRHKSWIFGPMWAGLVISTVVAFLWPDTFVSSALVRITASQVPEKFVQTNINQNLLDRINAIAQGVLSRSTLTNIIQTYDLYPREKRRVPLEDIIERMRKRDISIGALSIQQGQSRVGAFPISFQYENRYLAQKVTADIVSRLINENESTTIQISSQTTEFLNTEVAKAKTRLDEIEARLATFKVSNQGTLDTEQQMNLAAMNSLDQRISQVNASISRVNQDKLMMESNLRITRDQLAKAIEAATIVGDPQRTRQKNEQLTQKEREIAQTEQTLLQYRELYRDTHPDVRRIEAALASLRRQRDDLLKQEEEAVKAEKAEAPKTPPVKRVVATREIQSFDATIKQLETAIQGKVMELQDLNNEMTRLNQQVKSFQARIMASPGTSAQYAQIIRDYDQARNAYQGLKLKQEESERGTQVIRNKQGETLELLDQASLPVNPSAPNRPLIVGGGAIIGLLLGLVMVTFWEMKDTTLKNLKDVRAYTQLTVLGCVPLLEDDVVVKRRKRMGLLGWSTAVLVGIAVMGGAVAYYMVTNT
jgi:uncharacterized protein involved in exopolysaccharide biosynthesis